MVREISRQSFRRSKNQKLTKYKHSGFDFDDAAGHEIIQDTISKRVANAMNRHFS